MNNFNRDWKDQFEEDPELDFATIAISLGLAVVFVLLLFSERMF